MQSLPAVGSIVHKNTLYSILLQQQFTLKCAWFFAQLMWTPNRQNLSSVDYKHCSTQLCYQRTGWAKKNHTPAFSVQRVVDSSHCSCESVGWRVNVVELRRRRVNSRLSRMIFALRSTTSARRRYNYWPPLRVCNGLFFHAEIKLFLRERILFHTCNQEKERSFGNQNECERWFH